MLRADVVAAATAGQFAIHAVADVDEAMALLTGLPAGAAQPDGSFAGPGINQRVAARLAELTALRQSLARPAANKAAAEPDVTS
jgi:hypothetical protein